MSHDMFLQDPEADRRNYDVATVTSRQYTEWDEGDRDDIYNLFENLKWQDAAACKNSDPLIFFPPQGAPTTAAKAICRNCPTRKPCLEYALANGERFGVWGGFSERDRRSMRLKQRRRRAPCGSEAAYQRHRKNGEDACDACKKAHGLYDRMVAKRHRGDRFGATPNRLDADWRARKAGPDVA